MISINKIINLFIDGLIIIIIIIVSHVGLYFRLRNLEDKKEKIITIGIADILALITIIFVLKQ